MNMREVMVTMQRAATAVGESGVLSTRAVVEVDGVDVAIYVTREEGRKAAVDAVWEADAAGAVTVTVTG